MSTSNSNSNSNLLRLHAEQQFAEELHELKPGLTT